MQDQTLSQNLHYWRTRRVPTLHNTNPLPIVSNGVEVHAAGDVKFTTVDGDVETLTVPAEWVPHTIRAQVTHLWATGTTVANTNLRIGA